MYCSQRYMYMYSGNMYDGVSEDVLTGQARGISLDFLNYHWSDSQDKNSEL